MSQPALPSALQADLAKVDQLIRARISARPVVAQLVEQYEAAATHRRLRATLALLCTQLGQPQHEAALHAAAAVELIQIAMQVHSDLLGQGEPAGQAGAARHWPGDATLMLGDYLLALAAVEMTQAPDQRVIAFYSRAVMTICEGRLAPVTDLAPPERALEQYRAQISQTDAALVEAACKAGAVCGGLNEPQIVALGRFGHEVGLACRIATDVQGLSATPRAGAWRGQVTLPLLLAAQVDPALAALLQGHAALDNGHSGDILAAVQRSGALERASEQARQHAQAACDLLAGLPDTPARQTLGAVALAVAG